MVNATYPRTEFRGMWIASVLNVDWPSRTGLSVAAQKAELRSWLDLAVKRRLNTVLLQVRPAADRMWISTLGEPWSAYLTGTQGKDPGYDPLAYAVTEAHRRALSLHAWINPFRVSVGSSLTSLVATHPARKNPTWSFAYGGKRYYDPGVPAVRSYIISVVKDLVSRYDVDGVHFDDYFYPYPVAGQSIPDATTYAKYRGSFTSRETWRRNNVNVFIRDVHLAIHAAKARVCFGVSPFGIWRNLSSSTLGSATSGLESYSALYADSRAWVKSNWIDYVVPQLYWNQGFAAANYNVLVDWWAKQVAGTSVKLMTGEAAYKVNSGGAWNDPNELRDHLTKARAVRAVRGASFYNATAVRTNSLNSIGILAAAHYSRPALPVPLPNLSAARPNTPKIVSAVGCECRGEAHLDFLGSGGEDQVLGDLAMGFHRFGDSLYPIHRYLPAPRNHPHVHHAKLDGYRGGAGATLLVHDPGHQPDGYRFLKRHRHLHQGVAGNPSETSCRSPGLMPGLRSGYGARRTR